MKQSPFRQRSIVQEIPTLSTIIIAIIVPGVARCLRFWSRRRLILAPRERKIVCRFLSGRGVFWGGRLWPSGICLAHWFGSGAYKEHLDKYHRTPRVNTFQFDCTNNLIPRDRLWLWVIDWNNTCFSAWSHASLFGSDWSRGIICVFPYKPARWYLVLSDRVGPYVFLRIIPRDRSGRCVIARDTTCLAAWPHAIVLGSDFSRGILHVLQYDPTPSYCALSGRVGSYVFWCMIPSGRIWFWVIA